MAKPEECEGCEFRTKALQVYRKPVTREEVYLCDLCAGTPVGNAAFYPEQFSIHIDVLKTINYAANTILEAIRVQGR